MERELGQHAEDRLPGWTALDDLRGSEREPRLRGDHRAAECLLASGELFVYHPSDDVLTVHRERLTAGSACTPAQATAGWREKDFICMPSCGGAGGTACFQTKSCTTGTDVVGQPGFPGTSFDCASCCQ